MPPRQPTRHERLVAMANQTESPREAEIASNMLERTPEVKLELIATDIRAAVGQGLESQFTIGRLLSTARAQFENQDRAYGRWLAEQEFGFSVSYAYRLRWAADNEPEVRGYLESRASQTGKPGPEYGVAGAVVALNARPKAEVIAAAIEAENSINPWVNSYEAAVVAVTELRDHMANGWPLEDDMPPSEWDKVASDVGIMLLDLRAFVAKVAPWAQ